MNFNDKCYATRAVIELEYANTVKYLYKQLQKGVRKYWKATQTLFSVFVFKTIANSPSALVFNYINRKKVP